MEELKDIKGLMVIEEYSLYIFVALLCLLIILLVFIVKRFMFKKRKVSQIKVAKERLKNLDFSNSKICSYTLTHYASLIASQDEFQKLETLLQKYKYKKNEQEFMDEDIVEIKRFLEVHNA